MSNAFVNELLRRRNETQIEFVPEFNIFIILQTICAFLNGEGGWILIGHTGKRMNGIENLDQDAVENIRHQVSDRIFPQPLVYIQHMEYEGKNIALVNVLKGSRQPYSLDRKYFVKNGSAIREAGPDDISVLLRSSNEYNSAWEKISSIDTTFSDLDEKEIELTIQEGNKIGKTDSLPSEPTEFLSYFQLFDYDNVKNGALVLFGKTPVRFLMQCRIRITVLPEGKTGNRYDDTEIIEDNLFVSFTRVKEYLRKNLPLASEFRNDTWDRIIAEKYPSDALDEAIVNAMVHRDYGDVSGDITINIYGNKIEIINSGEIPPDIITGKSTIEAHHSVLRNPTIAHMFYLRGKMEKLGRGLALIKERFVKLGMRTPEWSAQSGYTTLTLYGEPRPIEFNDRMRAYLEQLGEQTRFSREEYVEFFKGEIKERTARADLQKLNEGKWLGKTGDGPTTRYFRTSKKLPDNAG